MKNSGNFTIRTMTRMEVDWAVQMAAVEGWNPGLYDAGCFYQTDPQGFLIGLLDNKAMACISAVSYQGNFGFMGFYIVLPEYRQQGYGLKLWKAALERLQGYNIGLDGVPEQTPNYIRSGFHLFYSNYRFEKSFSELPAANDPDIVSVHEIPFEIIHQYDRQCFPADRKTFLENWFNLPESTALGCLESSKLKGYGVIRKCRQGYKIGPLFADDASIAERLYKQLISKTEKNAPLYLDIPETNPAAMALAQKYQMQRVFATARMYSGRNPDTALHKVFGVTTFELG